jgi:hypothetical protein
MSKHFRMVCRMFPMGKWVHTPVIGEIGFLRNFTLYTAKIVFFGHNPIWVQGQSFRKLTTFPLLPHGKKGKPDKLLLFI